MTIVHHWLAEPLPPDVKNALARLAAAPGVRRIAVMPDVHLAEHVCVGTVVGVADRLYPQAVGGDIGCGIATVRLLGNRDLLDERAATAVLRELAARVPALRHRERQPLAPLELSDPTLARHCHRDLQFELGTLGRGNHFLELQADDEGGLWLMVHSGSRALGPAMRDHHLRIATPVGKGLRALPVDGPGVDYLRDHEVAVVFARDNRRTIATTAAEVFAEVLGIAIDWSTWHDVVHNFVRAEAHGGESLWVHRKGAASARVGESGAIPGSMGSWSFHVEGRGEAAALCSSSHGAGRRLPRGEAMRTISTRDLERELSAVFWQRENANALRDEAPRAYKDIGAVMRAQRDLVRIIRRLRPVLAFKGA
ncbi:MAG: RtcB family protein [Planctomycetes bacterium]|nr:RtcB family protein [Planctomycetota bacterium]